MNKFKKGGVPILANTKQNHNTKYIKDKLLIPLLISLLRLWETIYIRNIVKKRPEDLKACLIIMKFLLINLNLENLKIVKITKAICLTEE